jgi:hypothetical protein
MLAAFLVLSLMAHALCFYVFQIVYPTPVALLPPPGRVTFIAPDSEEGRTLLRWIDAEDPAVAFTTSSGTGSKAWRSAKTEHLPSYSAVEPILKELPPLKPDLRIPSSRPPRRRTFYRPDNGFRQRHRQDIHFFFQGTR